MITFEDLQLVGRNIRVHGNGFIQIDVSPSQRVHVFGHPSIPRQRFPTPVHSHRFGFYSVVLRGCLVNVDWKLHNVGRPHTHVACTTHVTQGEDTRLEPLDRTGWIEPTRTRTVCERESYTVSAGAFHESFANEPTVTHMTKTSMLDNYEPLVLCRIGAGGVDNAFNRYEALPDGLLWAIVQESFGA